MSIQKAAEERPAKTPEKPLKIDSPEVQNIIKFDPDVFNLEELAEKEGTPEKQETKKIEKVEEILKDLPTKSGFLGQVQQSCYRCHGKLRKWQTKN